MRRVCLRIRQIWLKFRQLLEDFHPCCIKENWYATPEELAEIDKLIEKHKRRQNGGQKE